MNINNIKHQIKTLPRTSFGVSMPALRGLARQIAKTDFEYFLTHNDYSSFELKLLHAMVIGYAKTDINTALQYFQDFMPVVDDWGVNDTLCQGFRIVQKYQKQGWDFLMQYASSTNEFESRIVAVTLLSHFLNDEYIGQVIQVLDKLNTNEYYSMMGVAWAIATAAAKYPVQTLDYLQSKNCNLDKATFNKSLQKIRESYRVPDYIKQWTKTV